MLGIALTKWQKDQLLLSQMKNERVTFEPHWKDLCDNIVPRRGRFFISDVNKGDRRNLKIIDSTATTAARTLQSGMMAGVTSPARPWFRLAVPDPQMMEIGAVKDWLYSTSQRMSSVFGRCNLYNSLPELYGDAGVFATGAMIIEEDFDQVIRTMVFPVGSYYIANDSKNRVRIFAREFRMTVRQLVEKFGESKTAEGINWDRFSVAVKNFWDMKQYETWIDVVHIIQPNDEYNPDRIESKYKKFSSCYYEAGTAGVGTASAPYATPFAGDRYLQEKGYDHFPVLVFRWGKTGEDAYGTSSPGMDALGDVKQLQLGEKRSAQGIEKMIMPPLVGPPELKNTTTSLLPGGITTLAERDGQKGLRAIHDTNIPIDKLEMKQQQVRQRVQKAFYEDMFLMLAESDRREITAREIDERKEEKLLALGPVLEQLNQDILDPLIDITFDIMLEQGLIPPPPEELQGVTLHVDYVSVMAQAQKLISIAGVERAASFFVQVAAVNPDIFDKVDIDQLADVYADLTSIPPGIIRSDDAVAAIRAQKAKAQQAQMAAQVAKDGAGAAKSLSQTDTTGPNALTALMQQAQAGQLAPQA